MRQYIGARYVPKFFVNGAGTSEWTANTQYEALTIVTRNGNSYTSKIPVPASAGAPENTPEYWVSTGIYNQQVADLADRTTALEGEMVSVKGRTSALEADMSLIKNRRFIFIGDSWFRYHSGADYTHFMDMVYTALGLTQGDDYYELEGGGYGFLGDSGQGKTWESMLQAATITDPDTITDIYVLGGINDRPYSIAQLDTAIGSFVSYAASRFPNAKVKIGCISWTTNSTYNGILRDTIIPAYRGCSKYGAIYISNIEYSAHIYSYLDGIHPTQSLQPYLFNAVMGAILEDKTDVKYQTGGTNSGVNESNVPAATWALEAGFAYDGVQTLENNFNVQLDNGVMNIASAQGMGLTVANKQLGLGYTLFAHITGGLVYGCAAGKNVYIPVTMMVTDSGGASYVSGFILIANGNGTSAEVYISANMPNKTLTALRFNQFSFSCPTLLT